MGDNRLLHMALYYHKLGWCVIPVPHGKKAARIKWGRYQKNRPTEAELKKWFGNGQIRNIAVVLGPVSGDLCCRDYDEESSYEAWRRAFPDLAKTLPTVKTSNGYHVYFLAMVESIRHLGDGELRGSGGYCMVPPSLHPDHVVYEWVNPPNEDNLLVIEPEKAGFFTKDGDVTERTENTESTEITEENRGEQRRCKGGEVCVDLNEKILAAIKRTVPTDITIRERHRKVFHFARELKSMPEYTEADPKVFRDIVRQWHRQALPNIGTKEFEETWIDFLKGWPKIRYKIGEEPMAQIFQKAVQFEPPRVAVEKYPSNDRLQLLTSLCRELQRAAGDGPFFLSCRTAARLMQASAMQVSRWFFLLEEDRILTVVAKGGTRENPRRATRFRYIGDREN